MFTEDELIRSEVYWMERIQNDMFREMDAFIKRNEFTQEQATPDTIADHVSALYASFLAHTPRYQNQQAAIRKFSANFLDDRENPPS